MRCAAIRLQFTFTFPLHIGERFGVVNLLSVVSFVSSSLCLRVLICNGIDYELSVGLIVVRRDVLALRTIADQATQSTPRTIILQVTATRGDTVLSKGLTAGRLRGE